LKIHERLPLAIVNAPCVVKFPQMSAEPFRISHIEGGFEVRDGLPRPNWPVIMGWAQTVSDTVDPHELWTEIAAHWLSQLAGALKNNYAIWESREFLVLCSREKAESERLIRYCETARKKILGLLGGVARDEGYGKIVVLLFHIPETYFDFIADTYPEEGEFGSSVGMFIRNDYSHIAVLAGPKSQTEATIAHELTHFLLKHLDLPLWLNEGVTQLAEQEVARDGRFVMTKELAQKHRLWWNSDTIQDFWNGKAFSAPDDRQELSYTLAETLAERLMRQFAGSFAEFAKTASASDAGEAALWNTCRLSLSQCVTDIFGNHDWSPRPSEWPEYKSEQ
jgi:hypothetical protein